MANIGMAKTPKRTWTSLLAQLILEPETKLELEHDFNSNYGAWSKSPLDRIWGH